jgi:hypothetical protein
MIIPMMQFFGSELTTATLTRSAGGAYNAAGIWESTVLATSSISVTYPQPVKMDELQLLEDGERISDYVKIYTADPIQGRVGAVDADRVAVLGETYKVTQVEDRPVGVFRKVIMKRVY